MSWNYDEWKSGWDFLNRNRKITKAMFMAVAIQCERALYNLLYNAKECANPKEDLTIQNAMKQLNEMAWLLFGKKNVTTIEYKDFAAMQSQTKEAILSRSKPFINGATFASPDGCVCRTQWVGVKEDKSLCLYSIHVNTETGEIGKLDEQLWNLAYQMHTIQGSGAKVSECRILYVDTTYRKPFRGQDASKAFINLDVTEWVKAFVTGVPYEDKDSKVVFGLVSVKDILERVNAVIDMQYLPTSEMVEPNMEMSRKCLEPYECPCYGHCQKLMNCQDSIIFKVGGLRKDKKFQLINMGYRDAEDLLFAVESEAISLSEKQIRQLEYEVDKQKVESLKNSKVPYKGKDRHIEKENLKNWFEDAFPKEARKLYFLDFETFQYAIPIWKNLAPYEKVPFQFSLHVWDRDEKTLEHYEFLSKKGKDPRRECAELLCRHIPMDGIGIAFNRGFEKSVLHKLGEYFPDLEEHLNAIADNMQDLMIPFQRHYYYRVEFAGKYSIKFVLPGLFPTDETLDYHNLEEIQNGVHAMEGYLKLQMAKRGEARATRKNMLAYCSLDTFAMVKIFWYLEKLILCDFDEDDAILEMEEYNGYSSQMKGIYPMDVPKTPKTKISVA